jgi:hypothetical protein
MNELLYKPNAADVIGRLRDLYTRRSPDRIFATMQVPSSALAAFRERHRETICPYPAPAERAAFWDEYFRERAAVLDDSLPSAYLSEFDQGLYGGLLGGDVRFMSHPDTGWISSMVPPLLEDWSEFDRLKFDPSHPWWQRYLDQMRVFVQAAAGKWGISHFILIDALNFVFELVGATNTYLSVQDCPDTVRRAIDFAYDLNVTVQEAFFAAVPALAGGTLSNFAQWVPGRVVSESVDPYHMTSVDFFEEWGREPAERIMTHFDGGVIHLHGNGRHLFDAVTTLQGLIAVLLLDDAGYPPAIDELPALRSRRPDVPLSCFVKHQDFRDRLDRHQLPGGVMYQVTGVPDIATANRLMDRVREYRW